MSSRRKSVISNFLQQEGLVKDWNQRYPGEGQVVEVRLDNQQIERTKTTSKAWMLGSDSQGKGGHTAVVDLESHRCYRLDRCTAILNAEKTA